MNLIGKVLAVVALISFSMSGRADDKAAAIARLRGVEAATSLDSPAVKPWHLKLSVQLFDAKGGPSEQGEIEEWWAGPQQSVISYTFPSYTGKVLQTADGTFRTQGIGIPPMMIAKVLDQVVHPMPHPADIAESEPVLRKQTVGQLALDCVMLSQPIKDIPVEPLGLYPTYCLDPAKDVLLATYDMGTVATVQFSVGLFQKITVATSIGINAGPAKIAEAKVVALAVLPPDPQRFVKSDGFEPVEKIANVPADWLNDQGLVKFPPVYPIEAKSKHEDGPVIFHAIVGRDGHVRVLQLKSATEASLALSAMYTVRQWTYKPPMLNGKNVDVESTIRVNFQYRGK